MTLSRCTTYIVTFIAITTGILCATPARAQDPPRPKPPVTTPQRDTTVHDTTPLPVRDSSFVRDSLLRIDSLRRAAHADSVPRQIPELRTGGARAGYASGVWEWNQEALLREGPITLGDLLRRIPGLTSLRAGGYSQPEALAAFGNTRGRVQIEIDGYVLDPLALSTFDVASLELVNLTGVRVDRRLDMTRIQLTTAVPVSTRPYTRLEVATGQPDINVFRAVFLVPDVVVGPLGIAIDRVGAEGNGRAEPASTLGGWAKWTWASHDNTRGLQFEYRRANLKRQGDSPWPTNETRQDMMLHARSRLGDGITAELFGGRSTLRQIPDSTLTASDDSVAPLERGAWQGGARAALVKGPVFGSATLRLRDGAALPRQELELAAGFDARILHLTGDFAQQSWSAGPAATTYDLRAEASPVAGLGAFVEYANGDRGAPIYGAVTGEDSTDIPDTHAITSRKSYRAGATINRFGIQGGGAVVRLEGPGTAPFGLPFDTAFVGSPVSPATGFETWGRIGFLRNHLFVDASYVYWTKVAGWTYLPGRQWRIAGEAHLSPLASGNLQVLARLESVFRGNMLAYGTPAAADSVQLQFEQLPENHVLNGYLQIRIIDVRAFIAFEDLLSKGRLDIPGRLIPGPRMYYGVKWELFN